MSTLLGPEETGAGAPGSSVRPACPAVRMPAGRAWFRLLLENCIVDASIFCICSFLLRCMLCQVFKGTRWMPWHQEPMKDAGACDMPRGAGSQAVIRGFPNGETWPSLWTVAAA